MILGRLNHVGVATPTIGNSIAFYRDVMGATSIGAVLATPLPVESPSPSHYHVM